MKVLSYIFSKKKPLKFLCFVKRLGKNKAYANALLVCHPESITTSVCPETLFHVVSK